MESLTIAIVICPFSVGITWSWRCTSGHLRGRGGHVARKLGTAVPATGALAGTFTSRAMYDATAFIGTLHVTIDGQRLERGR